MKSFEAKMAELAARFDARLANERDGFAAALAQGDRRDIVERAHRLAGIAGMFGADEMGRAASELEETASSYQDYTANARRLMTLIERRIAR